MGGPAGLCRAADATIMIRIELPIPVADARARARAGLAATAPAASGCAGRDVPIPVALLAEVTVPARHFPIGSASSRHRSGPKGSAGSPCLTAGARLTDERQTQYPNSDGCLRRD